MSGEHEGENGKYGGLHAETTCTTLHHTYLGVGNGGAESSTPVHAHIHYMEGHTYRASMFPFSFPVSLLFSFPFSFLSVFSILRDVAT